jgi:hypothetical protein
MQLTERFAAAEAAGSAVLGAGNAAYFALVSARERRAARRSGAMTLVLLNLALAAESALYLSVLPAGEAGALLFVRTMALTAAITIFAAICRARGGGGAR